MKNEREDAKRGKENVWTELEMDAKVVYERSRKGNK